MAATYVNLVRRVLGGAVRAACESRVPRSGEEGEAVNCFITKLAQGEAPAPVVLQIE